MWYYSEQLKLKAQERLSLPTLHLTSAEKRQTTLNCFQKKKEKRKKGHWEFKVWHIAGRWDVARNSQGSTRSPLLPWMLQDSVRPQTTCNTLTWGSVSVQARFSLLFASLRHRLPCAWPHPPKVRQSHSASLHLSLLTAALPHLTCKKLCPGRQVGTEGCCFSGFVFQQANEPAEQSQASRASLTT